MAKENTGTNGNTGTNENELSIEKRELLKLALIADYNKKFRLPMGKDDLNDIDYSQATKALEANGATDDDTLKLLVAVNKNSKTKVRKFNDEALKIVSKFIKTDGIDLGVEGDQNRLVGAINNWWKESFPYNKKTFSLNTKVAIAIEMIIHKNRQVPQIKIDGTITNLAIKKLNKETVNLLLKAVA